MAELEKRRGQYRLSTDRERIDVAAVHSFLTRSYWAEGISLDLVERSIASSLCFAVFDSGSSAGERQAAKRWSQGDVRAKGL
jgi:hypothetical protein